MMLKKILASFVLVSVMAISASMFAAFEAHVINVTAHIENALYVHPEAIAFGTVFPQEYVERQITVQMSTSFEAEGRVDDIEYVIKQKPKCECDEDFVSNPELCPEGQYAPVNYATHLCPEGYTEMLDLCQFLSKVDGDPNDNNDTSHPSYFVPAVPGGDPAHCINQPERFYGNMLRYSSTGWGGHSCPAGMIIVDGGTIGDTEPTVQGFAKPGTSVDGVDYPVYPHYTYTPPEEGYVVHNGPTGQDIQIWVDCLVANPDATGRLSKIEDDFLDLWIIDLKAPPFDGYVGQDWPAGCPVLPGDPDGQDFGCDLWIEITGISEVPIDT